MFYKRYCENVKTLKFFKRGVTIMKKLIKIIVSVVCLTMLSVSVVYAEEVSETSDLTASGYADFYESVKNSEEWINTDDRTLRGEMLQLPEEMLERMNTADLLNAVLDYPYFIDIYAFDDIQMGIERLFDNFNGAQELAQRSDAAEALMDKYENTEVLTSFETRRYT